jgi:hypothetical protein
MTENELKLNGLSACIAGGSVHTKRAEVWRMTEIKAREGEAKERENVSSSLQGTAYCR